MRNAGFAEWMLARWIDRDRALAIVGDLEEAALQKGGAWFWRSFVGVWVASGWRPVAGFVVAAFGGGYLASRILRAFFYSTLQHTPTRIQRVWGSSLAFPIALLCFVALYGAFRFGLRDVVTRVAAAYAVLGTVADCFWWQRTVPLVVLGLAATLLLASLFDRRTRRGTAVVWSIAGILAVLWLAVADLASVCAKKWRPPQGALTLSGLATYFAMVWVVCLVCSRMHQRFLESCSDTGEVSL
ncbi:MAG TPA: hypothetical protein VI320_09840 [Terracidiphilus sp.]|jgi:hypothetical protein